MAQQNPHRQGERRTRRPVYFDVFKVVATAFDVQPVATVPEENAFIYRHGNDITIAAQTSRFIKWDVYFDLPQLYVGMVIAGRVEGYQGALLKRCIICDEWCVNKGFRYCCYYSSWNASGCYSYAGKLYILFCRIIPKKPITVSVQNYRIWSINSSKEVMRIIS